VLKNLRKVIGELDKYEERLFYAKREIEKWLPLKEEDLENSQKVAVLDSFAFRFSKLQDSMGTKLFPLILEKLGEPAEEMPYIDVVNRLEKLGLIPSAEEWFELRALRNLLVHTYPWETEKISKNLEVALKKADRLVEIYEHLKRFLKRRRLL